MSIRDVGGRIRARFKKFGVAATPDQIDQLVTYFGLLAKWNKTVNLTALSLDPATDAAIDRLFVEPFLAAQLAAKSLGLATGWLMDIGSGGGSPAIPLRVALPATQLRMVESKARKSAFLREAVRHLAFPDTEVLNSRTETLLAHVDLHESASILSIRAVKLDRPMWETIAAFLKPGGVVLWFRTGSDQGSSSAAFPSFVLEATHRLVPANFSEVVVLRKG